MASVTIRYGMTNSVTRDFDNEATISDVVSDNGIRAALSAPENVRAVSGGRTLEGHEYVTSFTAITLEQQASSKA
jgi:hypothetical protein|tara:strand:+ start:1948 stop:2172 length:225 start_codon:yes stop_codon:yes gene_type:complete